MEILLIDIGALAVFLAYIAIVYWHAISHEPDPATRKGGQGDPLLRRHGIHLRTRAESRDDRTVPASAAATSANYLDRESATARSARSSVEIGQCASQPMQYASMSAPDSSSSASSSRAYPVSMRSRPHFGHSDENGV